MPESRKRIDGARAAPLQELARELRELVGREVQFARNEVIGELRRAGTAAAVLGSAAVVGTVGGAMFPVAVATWIGRPDPRPRTFLLLGAGFLAISGALAYVGVKRLAEIDPVPRRALDALGGLADEILAPGEARA